MGSNVSKKEKKVKVRRFWNIDPATRVEEDSTQTYNRAQAKKDWLDELDDDLHNSIEEDFIDDTPQ